MSTASIVLLAVGVVFIVASFFLPDSRKKEDKDSQKIDEKVIKEMVEREVSNAKERIEEIVDETVNYSVEKTERQLEKLSNEKIMAVDEYSETVLKRINDNHKEAVFLYDMLNDKGEKLKNSDEALKIKDEELKEKNRQLEVKEEILKVKDEELSKKAEFTNDLLSSVSAAEADAPDASKPEEPEFVPLKPQKVSAKRTVKKPVTGKTVGAPRMNVSDNDEDGPGTDKSPEVELYFDRDNESRKNKNDQIRKMHEEGKSNMAIAKELGLGVGEVKLVIDLFANKK
jgi:hypothetical protein